MTCELSASARKVTQLLRSRLGCHNLPSVAGRRSNPRVPRHERTCTRCHDGLGDEKHLPFECSALQHHRYIFSFLFIGHDTTRFFMNQGCQRDMMHFISECLDFDDEHVGDTR